MAAPSGEVGGKDDIKTQFVTREGTYRLLTLSEYSHPNRIAYSTQSNVPVKLSFIAVADSTGNGERICFNIGRELYFYAYRGVRKAADLTKPIDKRVYKGTMPTCHHINPLTAHSDSVALLVGFSAGQVQLIDPIKKELSKLYNEERLIDKTKVTCIKWVPGSSQQFLVSHASGHLYVYNEASPCGQNPPTYQMFKQGEGYKIETCRTRTSCNPLYRWTVGEGPINEFAFGPDNKRFAVVSQDGYLRIFDFDSLSLVGSMKSYFGGLLCCSWSPDGKYVATGGEDDLVSVYSVAEQRVICRGQGHNSWVNVVAFDPFTCHLGGGVSGGLDDEDDDEEEEDDCSEAETGADSRDAFGRSPPSDVVDAGQPRFNGGCGCGADALPSPPQQQRSRYYQRPVNGNFSDDHASPNYHHHPGCNGPPRRSGDALKDACNSVKVYGAGDADNYVVGSSLGVVGCPASRSPPCVNYRIGSIGQDTLLCLWDLTEDLLRPPAPRARANTSVSACSRLSPTPGAVNGNSGAAASPGVVGRVNGDAAHVLSPAASTVATDQRSSSGSHNAAAPPASHSLGRKGEATNHLDNNAGAVNGPPLPPQQRTSSSSLSQKLSSLTLGHHHSKDKGEKGAGDKGGADRKDKDKGKAGDENHLSNDFFGGFHGRKKDKGGGGGGGGGRGSNSNASQSSGAVGNAANSTSSKPGHNNDNNEEDETVRLLGTPSCPRLEDLHILEPLICKKIAHERLTALCFREDCLVTACQEGFVCTWARPGKVNFGTQQQQFSPQQQQQPPPQCQSPQLPSHHHLHHNQEQQQQQPQQQQRGSPQTAAPPPSHPAHSIGNMSSTSHLPQPHHHHHHHHHHHSTHNEHSIYNRLQCREVID